MVPHSIMLVRQHAGTRGGCRRAGPVCGHPAARSAQDRQSDRAFHASWPSATAYSLNQAGVTTQTANSGVIASSVIRIAMLGLPLTERSGKPEPKPKLRVPKTCATWANALRSAVDRSACAGPVLARPEVG